jgi:hypothetical protein
MSKVVQKKAKAATEEEGDDGPLGRNLNKYFYGIRYLIDSGTLIPYQTLKLVIPKALLVLVKEEEKMLRQQQGLEEEDEEEEEEKEKKKVKSSNSTSLRCYITKKGEIVYTGGKNEVECAKNTKILKLILTHVNVVMEFNKYKSTKVKKLRWNPINHAKFLFNEDVSTGKTQQIAEITLGDLCSYALIDEMYGSGKAKFEGKSSIYKKYARQALDTLCPNFDPSETASPVGNKNRIKKKKVIRRNSLILNKKKKTKADSRRTDQGEEEEEEDDDDDENDEVPLNKVEMARYVKKMHPIINKKVIGDSKYGSRGHIFTPLFGKATEWLEKDVDELNVYKARNKRKIEHLDDSDEEQENISDDDEKEEEEVENQPSKRRKTVQLTKKQPAKRKGSKKKTKGDEEKTKRTNKIVIENDEGGSVPTKKKQKAKSSKQRVVDVLVEEETEEQIDLERAMTSRIISPSGKPAAPAPAKKTVAVPVPRAKSAAKNVALPTPQPTPTKAKQTAEAVPKKGVELVRQNKPKSTPTVTKLLTDADFDEHEQFRRKMLASIIPPRRPAAAKK